MPTKIIHAVVLTVVFPFLLSLVVYYGFGTNYTGGVFHEAGFRQQYEHGIYKYRVLGPILLIKTYGFMKSEWLPAPITRGFSKTLPASTRILDEQADGLFYAAYFIQNTFFLVLGSIVLYLLLTHRYPANASSVSSSQMIGTFLMVITQYVVCPYDTLSYSLILLSFLLIVRPFRFSYLVLLLVLVINTLSRESAALTLSFFFSYHYSKIISLNRKELRQLAGLVGMFFATYTLIRLHFGFDDHTLYQSVQLESNLRHPLGLAGILALPVVAYSLCAETRNLKRCLIFTLASSPYFLGMIAIASTWEIRLWVPVWLGLLILTRDIPNKSVQTTIDSAPERSVTCA